ncbi:hypothetical protein [Mucilaginibacter sp.]
MAFENSVEVTMGDNTSYAKLQEVLFEYSSPKDGLCIVKYQYDVIAVI